MLPTLSDIPCFVQFLLDWAEGHPGLGSWVGALGSVLAIFAAWLLARHEYRRNQREAAIRKGGEIDLICKIISDYEALLVSVYIDSVKAGTQGHLVGFYNQHMNDPEWHSMRDLACVPVTQWPSLEAYARFKQYWFISNQILETSHVNASEIDIRKALSEHDARLKELNAALQNALR